MIIDQVNLTGDLRSLDSKGLDNGSLEPADTNIDNKTTTKLPPAGTLVSCLGLDRTIHELKRLVRERTKTLPRLESAAEGLEEDAGLPANLTRPKRSLKQLGLNKVLRVEEREITKSLRAGTLGKIFLRTAGRFGS